MAAVIAREANVSDRTVRRVIAHLEAGGHVPVHRGDGRAGAANSNAVITGTHSPGQDVTPLTSCPGVTAMTPAPDTGEPPLNYQGTAAPAKRLDPAVTDALTAGWTPDALAEVAGPNTAGIRNPAASLAARLSPAGFRGRSRMPRNGRRGAASATKPPGYWATTATRRAPARAARAQPNRRSFRTQDSLRPHRRKQANAISSDSFDARSYR